MWLQHNLYSKVFQSTLPVGGSDIILLRVRDYHNISIHAPRMGSDERRWFA
mgnify:CR=1 FL=1